MKHSRRHLSGILLMIQSSGAFALMALAVKWLSTSLPCLEVVFFRSLFGALLIYAVMVQKKVPVIGHAKWLLLGRGFSGFIALTLNFYAISKLPLGTAMLLNYTSPIFATILAILFLKERPNAWVVSMILVSFCGVYLLAGGGIPSSAGASFAGWIGLLSAFFAAIAYIFIRSIKHRESPLTIIFHFTGFSTVGALFYLGFGFKWPNWIEWLVLVGIGIASFYGQLWMTIALRRIPASLASPFSYVAPLLSFVFGAVFFGDAITLTVVAGAILIIASSSLISYFGTAKSSKASALESE